MGEGWGPPVTADLLTGFLGSGKTSLLRRLLRLPRLADTAVLINELGEAGLDHLLVEEVGEEVVLLQSGCVCCTIRGDLRDAIGGLIGRMRRGEIPVFRRLVVETTGLADPGPIVATLSADPALRHHVRLGNVVTVVDAVDGARNLDVFPEARKQAAVADRIVVSKTDLADGTAVAALRARLADLNPTAVLHESAAGSEAAEALLLHDVHDPAGKAEEVRRWLAAEATHAAGARSHGHGESRHGGIEAFCLSAAEPLDWAAFGLWLSMLLNRHGSAILRVKGLLRIAGRDRPVVVQGVQHTVHLPEHLPAWPDGVARTRLVVIARGLDPALVERSFRAFLRIGRSKGQASASA